MKARVVSVPAMVDAPIRVAPSYLTTSPEPAMLPDMAGISYPGGKGGSGVAQTLINLMPPHDVYIEAFLGSGAVMRAKRPAAVNIGLDRSPAALDLAMTDLPIDRISPVAEVPAGIRGIDDDAGGIAGSGVQDPHVETDDWIQTTCGDVDRRTSPVWKMLQVDSIQWLKNKHLFTPSMLIYCDPPYLTSTRSTARRLYEFEMSSAQHVDFLHVVNSLNCMVMISGYESDLYRKALAKWNHHTYQTTNRSGALVTEWVWFNYPVPVELHDYNYLGENFRQRERIKRKKQRWVARLQRMPQLERQALYSAIQQAWGPVSAGESPAVD